MKKTKDRSLNAANKRSVILLRSNILAEYERE